jgi:hypothetical protein
MSFLKKLKSIISEKNLQEKDNNRNRVILNISIELGFSLPAIRKSLLDLNEIKLKSMIDGRTSFGTLSRTNKGSLENAEAKIIIAEKLNLKIEELFPMKNAHE